VAAAARAAGLDPRSLLVGHPRGRINPRTGQQEFYEGWETIGSEGNFDPISEDWWNDGEMRDFGADGGSPGGGGNGGSDGPIETVTVTAPRTPDFRPDPPKLIDPGLPDIGVPTAFTVGPSKEDLIKARDALREAIRRIEVGQHVIHGASIAGIVAGAPVELPTGLAWAASEIGSQYLNSKLDDLNRQIEQFDGPK
jgi:hypothetical protein